MSRHPKWDARLAECVSRCRRKPYTPSHHDCLLWPAEAVKAVTGKDHGRGHRGKYKSTATAYRYLQSLGFKSPEAYLDSLFETKPVGFAQRGDLVLVHTESGDNPGVCMGSFVLVAGETELLRAPRALWLKAWAV